MNTAILLSGGIGARIQSNVPKQYIRINGKMIITYSLQTLTDSSDLDEIQIVAEDEWREPILADAEKYNIPTDKIKGFAKPGANRQASILSGMKDILRRNSGNVDGMRDNVLVHDAARPLLAQRQIHDCFVNLHGHDGVMPVLPMKDTVYLSSNGRTVSELVDRNSLFAGQAPELFNLRKYYQANVDLTQEQMALINGATEPAILAGMDIVMIPGDENNFKVTTQADLDRFCGLVGK